MAVRVSILWALNSARSGGWSENFWFDGTNTEQARRPGFALMEALSLIHGYETIPQAIRYTALDANGYPTRQVDLYETGYAFNPGIRTPSPTVAADYADTALLLRLTDSNNVKTNVWINGIWDGVVTNGGSYSPTPAFVNGLNAVQGILTGNFGWMTRTQNPALKINVTAVDKVTGIATLAGAQIWPEGSLVSITGAVGNSVYLRGRWRIHPVDATHIQLYGWDPPLSFDQTGLGRTKVMQVVYRFSRILLADVKRVTRHKVGRPFGLLSGRAKSRR